MIKTSIIVPKHAIDHCGWDQAFCNAVTRWERTEWAKYLRKHGTIINVEHLFDDLDVFQITWNLPPVRETWFRFKFPSRVD
jgi:hypothetical protein